MSSEPEHPDADSPDFEPTAQVVQPDYAHSPDAPPPPAPRSEHPEHFESDPEAERSEADRFRAETDRSKAEADKFRAEIEKTKAKAEADETKAKADADAAKAKADADKSKGKPAPAARQSTSSLLSSAILMIVGAAIAGGTFYLARVFAPPKPPGEVAEKPPADMVKTEDFKKLSDHVDQMSNDLKTAQKQISDRPDYDPDIRTLRDRMTELDRKLAGMPAMFDSINQKLATMSKVEDSSSSTQVDAINRRVTDLSNMVDLLRNSPNSGRVPANTAGSNTTDPRANGTALAIAIDLYKNKQWNEAKDAFDKLQLAAPNDATVWYLSALVNGFSTNQWQGETERLVNVGLEKEKTGQTTSTAVDRQTDFLTGPTGKDWLAAYRKRINAR